MKHLSEEELVAHFYGEAADRSDPGGSDPDGSGEDRSAEKGSIGRHLNACAECAERLAALRSDLAALHFAEPPARDEGYGKQVWAALKDRLPAYEAEKARWARIGVWRGLGYAAACALVVMVAFFAGRAWEHRHQPQTAAAKNPQAQKQVILVVLGDHLDRSERLLVELKHADAGSAELVSPMREEARSLLAANQVCRQDARQMGDPALGAALDRLDSLLNELANEPGGLDGAAIARLQNEMNGEGLLFEVRVLRSRMPEVQTGRSTRTNGGTI
jgi:hypothetical protein